MRPRGTGSIEWRPKGGARIVYVDTSGQVHRESVAKAIGKPAATLTDQDCQALLYRRLGEIHAGIFLPPAAQQRTMDELIAAKRAAYEVQRHGQPERAAAVRNMRGDYERLARAFAGRRVAHVTAAAIVAWQQQELAAGAALGTVKKLTDILRSIFHYAIRTKLIPDAARPYIESLQVDNVRRNFCTPEQTADLMACAREIGEPDVADVVDFARLTGWRHATIMGLSWPMVDRRVGEIRIPTGKAGGHTLDTGLSGALAALIERRWKARALGCAIVFHRKGRPFTKGTWHRAFTAARAAAGLPDVWLHDFRRVAYRDLKRAGVDTFTAMEIVHHKTLNHARRYNMLRETDHHRDMLLRRDAYLDRMTGQNA
jgi:site-specific recombinase XerD